jgi:hypothetical protein
MQPACKFGQWRKRRDNAAPARNKSFENDYQERSIVRLVRGGDATSNA